MLNLPPEENLPTLSLELWKLEAPQAPRLFLKLDDTLRELSAEEALTVAHKLIEAATYMTAREGADARAAIQASLNELGKA